MWPLVLIHGTIDFVSDVFDKRWEHYLAFGVSVVALYFLVSVVVLLRMPAAEREGDAALAERTP